MKISNLIIVFSLITFSSCSQKSEKKKIDPKAIELNNKIVPLSMYLQNPDSCKKALSFLDSATAIDSNYFLGYQNKLMFLSSLKEYDKAIIAINNCIRIRPETYYLYDQGGFLYQTIGDTINSKKYFQKSVDLISPILDTMSVQNRDYGNLKFNFATTFIMLDDTAKANQLLTTLYYMPGYDSKLYGFDKSIIQTFMHKTKEQLKKEGLIPF